MLTRIDRIRARRGGHRSDFVAAACDRLFATNEAHDWLNEHEGRYPCTRQEWERTRPHLRYPETPMEWKRLCELGLLERKAEEETRCGRRNRWTSRSTRSALLARSRWRHSAHFFAPVLRSETNLPALIANGANVGKPVRSRVTSRTPRTSGIAPAERRGCCGQQNVVQQFSIGPRAAPIPVTIPVDTVAAASIFTITKIL